MPFVLDASSAHAWAFREISEVADAVRARLRSDAALAPSLWWFELRNGLVTAERRRRTTERETAEFLGWIAELGVKIDPLPNEAAVMTLARRHRVESPVVLDAPADPPSVPPPSSSPTPLMHDAAAAILTNSIDLSAVPTCPAENASLRP